MRTIINNAVDFVLQIVRRVLFLTMRAISVREDVLGIEVIDLLANDVHESSIDRISRALDLISRHNPILLRRIRDSVRGIVINDSRTGYLEDLRVCVLNGPRLNSETAEQTALAVAHESTHAVLHKRGFRYRKNMRGRIERACINAEIRLARKLPNAAHLIDLAMGNLQNVWWTDEQLRAAREDELRNAGVPAWMIRFRRALFE